MIENENNQDDFKEKSKFIENNYKISFDEILDKIGYTKFHIIMILIVGLSLAADGVEIYLIYLIAPVLKQIYFLNDHSVSIIVSSLFLGIAIGAITSGIFVKQHGRRKVMLFFLTVISIFGTICVLIENVYWFLICRFMIGISVGILFNLTNALCEILPKKYRDFIMGSIYIYVKIGIVYFVFIFYLFTHETDPIYNYQHIVIVSNIPMYICLILSYLFYEESPRILFLEEENFEEGCQIIEKIAHNSEYDFNQHEKEGLKNYLNLKKLDESQINSNEENSSTFNILTSLFKKKYCKLFILVIFLWSINVMILFTNLYLLPILLNKQSDRERLKFNETFVNNLNKMKLNSTSIENNNNFTNIAANYDEKTERQQKMRKILIANLIPIPAEILAGIFTSSPILGRKNTMKIGFFFEFVFAMLMYLNPEYLHFHSSMIIFFNVLSFNICKLYTTEAFHTKKRDMAFGFSNFVSRIVSIFIPYITNFFLFYSDFATCIYIGIVSILGLILTMLLPFDTFNRPLDQNEEEDMEEENKIDSSENILTKI